MEPNDQHVERPLYRYQSLPERPGKWTRVIRLPTGTLGDRFVHFDLVPMDLGCPPRYHAVSYDWGGQSPDQVVYCEEAELRVTENAKTAIQTVQREWETTDERYLWIDSICIDQDNKKEKNDQVKNMGIIYQKAQEVDVCLSGGQAAKQALAQIDDVPEDGKTFKETACMRERMQLQAICYHPYWTRIWTVQEMSLAQSFNLYLGGEPLIKDLLDAMPLLEDTGQQDAFESHYMPIGRGRRWETDDVARLLITLVKNKASQEHDYIYGLRELYNVTLDSIEVDYSRDTVDLFCEVARRILKNQCWALLRVANHPGKRPGCPSWVPDWGSPGKRVWRTVTGRQLPETWSQGGRKRRRDDNNGEDDPDDRRVFPLRGTFLGRVELSASDYMVQSGQAKCFDCWRTDHERPTAARQYVENMWKTVILWIKTCQNLTERRDYEGWFERHMNRGIPHQKLASRVFTDDPTSPLMRRLVALSQLVNANSYEAAMRFIYLLVHRDFFVCDNYHRIPLVGIASCQLEPDDIIVKLDPKGAGIFALRPDTNEGAGERVRYRLLGDVDLFNQEAENRGFETFFIV